MAVISREKLNLLGKTNFRNKEVIFGIKPDDRRRHIYIIGKTGMGKTTLIENMIVQDIVNGNGLAFVDPHGEAVEKILNYIPSNRINDVVYFNPADLDYPIAFNPLESVDPKYKHLVASGLMGVFTKMWANVWSARMEYILNNTILALLDTPGNTMLGIARMLVDKKFRKKIVDNVRDPIVKSFWVDEFANYNERFRSEAIAPIQNKVGQFLSSSIIRNIVGQTKSTINLREIMDDKKILLLNLSKGRIGEDNSNLLGAMFITRLQLAAMSRVDILEEQRQDFYMYVDEFQNFATESFATILSEARKYRLDLVIAHQYIEQLDEKVAAAVFGNVGTMICFRIGATDAEKLEIEFMPTFEQNHLINLSKYHVYLKLMIDGVASKPFNAITLPPLAEKTGNEEKVIAVSRERYGKPRSEIEQKITRWMGQEYHENLSQQELTEEEDTQRGGVIFQGPIKEEKEEEKKQEKIEQIQDKMIKEEENKERKEPQRPTTTPAPRATFRPRRPENQRRSPETPRFHREPQQRQLNRGDKIWSEAINDTEKKMEDTVKRMPGKLFFDFGGSKTEQPAKPEAKLAEEPKKPERPNDIQKKPESAVPEPKDRKTLKPGETIKF